MKYSQSVITKAYAKAYLNNYGSVLSVHDIECMKKAVLFFREHHNFMSLVNVLISGSDQKQTIVQELFEHFSLHKSLYRLISVLKTHKKLILFGQTLQDICCLYGIRNNILEVTIFTACALSDQEIKKFESFFVKFSDKKIITTVHIDSALIAGVRMQSDFYLWEYSIASQLKKIQQNILLKE